MATPAIGATAPDFTLPGIVRDGEDFAEHEFSLSAERGHPVVVVFYPGDESSVCTAQLCSYQAELAQFAGLGATVLAISKQGIASHLHFARKEGLKFPLLADERGVAVTAFGVGAPGIGLRRSVFVIDAAGVVRWKHVAIVGARFRSAAEIEGALHDLAA